MRLYCTRKLGRKGLEFFNPACHNLVWDLVFPARRGCFTPEIHDHPAAISVATFGPWLHDLGVDALQEAGRCLRVVWSHLRTSSL